MYYKRHATNYVEGSNTFKITVVNTNTKTKEHTNKNSNKSNNNNFIVSITANEGYSKILKISLISK